MAEKHRKKTPQRAAQQREASMRWDREQRKKARDVDIPAVVDPARKARCGKSLRLFARTYFPTLFYMNSSQTHHDILERLQRRIKYGGNEAIAAPRGLGKDTLFLVAVLWAILYGYRKFLVYVCPSMGDAEKKLRRIMKQIETNPLLLEDFPEVCAPVRALERAAQRGRTQTVNGEFTYIEWGAGMAKFPQVPGSLSSGAVMVAGGIDGSMRGQVEDTRPDFAAVNDIETDEAAKSVVQRKNNEEKIDKGIGGMRGPGKTMTKVMLCTIACKGCLSEKYTDPEQKPAWNGHRYQSIKKWPIREGHIDKDKGPLWEEYFAMRRDGQADRSDPYGRKAQKFYRKNKKAMDAGFVVVWPENYIRSEQEDGKPSEISALEHIMIEWCDNGDDYFWSELQNDPQDPDSMLGGLTKEIVRSRLSGFPPRTVPDDVFRVVRGIDVGGSEGHWVILGVKRDGGSYVLDYGRNKVDAPEGIDKVRKDAVGRPALEKAVLEMLRGIARESDGEGFLLDTKGNPRYIDLTCVDSGYLPRVVYKFCREHGQRYRPIKGLGTRKNQPRYNVPEGDKNIKRGYNYFAKRDKKNQSILWSINDDYWKEYTQLRFLQDPGTQGCCLMWGSDPKQHRLFSSHIMAEHFDMDTNQWVQDSYNHYLDSIKMAHCAGHMMGIRLGALTERAGNHPPSGTRQATGGVVAPPKEQGERVLRRKRAQGAW